MKSQGFLFLLCGTLTIQSAELYLSPSHAPAKLSIAQGEALLISTVARAQFSNDGFPPPPGGSPLGGRLVVEGKTNSFTFGSKPALIAGPGDLYFRDPMAGFESEAFPVMVVFTRVTNPNIRTFFMRGSMALLPGEVEVPQVIEVPAGKVCVLSSPRNTSAAVIGEPIIAKVESGERGLARVYLNGDEEIPGPAKITFLTENLMFGYMMTYTLSADFNAQARLGAVKGPAGAFNLTVEQSTDLNTWAPLLMHQGSSQTDAFYRFRIAK